jgi:two-component system, OmpR family, KDP operon response regulator KdpE
MMGRQILLIDDDEHLLLGLAARLRGSGYRVICATDAISGITLARKETPDLIILDLGLPRDEGFEVLEQMRRLTDLVAIPVIILSARDPATNHKRALDAGAVAFFQKPPDNNQFLSAIRQTLGEAIGLSTFLRA